MKLKHPFLLNIFHTIQQEGLWIHVTYAWLMFYSWFSGMPEEHSFPWRIRVRIAVWELHSPTVNVIRCPVTGEKLPVEGSTTALTIQNLPSLSLGSKERGHRLVSSRFFETWTLRVMEGRLYIGLVLLFGKKKKLFNVCQTFYFFNPLKRNCRNCLQKQNPQTYASYYLISST